MATPEFVNSSVKRDFNFTNTQNQISLTIPRVNIATFPVKIAGSLAYDVVTTTLWYSDGLSWLPISGLAIPSVPNVQVYPIKPRGSLVYDIATNTVWYSTGVVWQPMTTTPSVADITVFNVLQEGTVVYDDATNTLWYSDGVQWLQLSAEKILQDTITIYANAQTGSDNNDGLTPGTAVETIQKGLDVMSKYLAHTGILQLQGNVVFDLGTDPTLNLFPCTSSVGTIIIRGEMIDTISDTVASIPSPSGIGPFDSWRVINGTTGGYPATFYNGWHIKNDTQDRVYVVDTNGVSSVNTITGDGAIADGKGDSWMVGDAFTLFRVQQEIVFSGTFTLSNPSNSNVIFESLFTTPDVGASMVCPILQVTTFRGCELGCNSSRSYTGGITIEGCYSYNQSGSQTLFPYDDPTPKTINSFTLDGPKIELTAPSIVNFLNLINTNDAEIGIFCSSDLQGTSINITNNTAYYGIYVGDYYLNSSGLPVGGNVALTDVYIETGIGVVSGVLIYVGGMFGPKMTLTNFRGVNTSSVPDPSIQLAFGGEMTMRGGTIDVTSTGQILNAYVGSTLILNVNGDVSFVTSGTATVMSASECSKIIIRGDSGTMSVTRAAASGNALIGIVQESVMELNMNGDVVYTFSCNSTNAVLGTLDSGRISITGNFGSTMNITNTNADGRGVYCSRKGVYIYTTPTVATYLTTQVTLTKATIVLESGASCLLRGTLNDATAARILICGNNAAIAGPGPYSTSQNDYAAAPPQNCYISFG